MRYLFRVAGFAAVLLAFVLSSCGGGSGSGSPGLRVVDAAYGAPYNFDVLVNSASIVTDMAYLQASAFEAIASGSTNVQFEPTGTTTVAVSNSFDASDGYNYSVLVVQGQAALTSLVVAQSNSAVSSGQARLTFVGAASGVGSLDFFVTSPSAALPAAASMPAVAYPGDGATVAPVPLVLDAGDYRIRAIATGDATQTVIFDSGPISLDSGTDLLLAVIPTSGSAANFSLLSLDDNSNVYQISDQRVQIRVGNFAPAVGSVDAYLDAVGSSGSSGTLLDSGMALGGASAYQDVLPGAYRASFTASGQAAEISGLGSDLALAPSTAMSVFAVGFAGQGAPDNLQLLALQDNLLAPASGMVKLRVVQLAPDINNAGTNLIDVVVLDASGTPTSPPLVGSLAYTGASQYLSLPAGSYTVALVPSGLQAPVLPSGSGVLLNLTAGSIQTLVVAGCQTPGSGICASAPNAALQLLLLQDN